jgi:hypothetical protein
MPSNGIPTVLSDKRSMLLVLTTRAAGCYSTPKLTRVTLKMLAIPLNEARLCDPKAFGKATV